MGCGSQKPPEGGRGVLAAEPLPRPRGHGYLGSAEPGPSLFWEWEDLGVVIHSIQQACSQRLMR